MSGSSCDIRCEECNEPIQNIRESIVEWLSMDDWALALYIRIVHPDCCYYKKKRQLLEDINAYDHWLPLVDMETLLDIAFEMPWDNKNLAESAFIRYIIERNQLNEVQHEND
jgi:hypothetical protein